MFLYELYEPYIFFHTTVGIKIYRVSTALTSPALVLDNSKKRKRPTGSFEISKARNHFFTVRIKKLEIKKYILSYSFTAVIVTLSFSRDSTVISVEKRSRVKMMPIHVFFFLF